MAATVYTEETIGPKKPYYEYDFAGAKFIWTDDILLDNTVIFRYRVKAPPNGDPLPPDWPRGKINPDDT